jgi:hypothetical protein
MTVTRKEDKVFVSDASDKPKSKSLIDLAMGGVKERIAYEMPRILANIVDPNTDAKKARTMTITVKFTPSADRMYPSVSFTVNSKLQPTDPIHTTLMLYDEGNGVQALEVGKQIPGQGNLDGSEEPQAAILEQIIL